MKQKKELTKELIARIEGIKSVEVLYKVLDFIDFIVQKYDEVEWSDDEVRLLNDTENESSYSKCRKNQSS